jgi:regulator of sigma E protease
VSPLLELAALLSINLGVLNLLPLPMLDGGRIFFLLIEIARGGKRIAPEKEALVHMAGFAIFISFALVVTFLDISRIANGESVFR